MIGDVSPAPVSLSLINATPDSYPVYGDIIHLPYLIFTSIQLHLQRVGCTATL